MIFVLYKVAPLARTQLVSLEWCDCHLQLIPSQFWVLLWQFLMNFLKCLNLRESFMLIFWKHTEKIFFSWNKRQVKKLPSLLLPFWSLVHLERLWTKLLVPSPPFGIGSGVFLFTYCILFPSFFWYPLRVFLLTHHKDIFNWRNKTRGSKEVREKEENNNTMFSSLYRTDSRWGASRLREMFSRVELMVGFSLKAVERTGRTLQSQFPLTNLWDWAPCGREEECRTCSQNAQNIQ